MSSADPLRNSVLVTGANGYIGNAVARAFVRSGWKTHGLVRKEPSLVSLAKEEIIPIPGSLSDPSFLAPLKAQGVVFDVIVSTTEQMNDYIPHYNGVVSFLRTVARNSNEAGVRPLVIFTSGCKDYGMMDKLADSPDLKPHTEESPLNPFPFAGIIARANHAIKIFDHTDLFDAIVTRPTNVYGSDSSHYGMFFKLAAKGKEKGVLELHEDPRTILHAMHVDDCAEAYVALAEHPHRAVIRGQCYNIAAYRYETLDEIAKALVKEYDIGGGVNYLPQKEGTSFEVIWERAVLGFSQWTGSAKLRKDVGV